MGDTPHEQETNIHISIKINRIIKFLVLSDFLFLGGWSLINPLFSVFVVDHVAGATLATAGFVSALYWLVKSVIQMPVANFLDRTEGEKDEFYTLVFALMLAAITAFSFALVENVSQLYVVQFFHAIAMALYIPSWTTLFSHHLEKKHTAFDWSLDSTVIGVGAFLAAGVSGVLANAFGFSFVFLVVGILSLLSAFLLIAVPNLIIPKPTTSDRPLSAFRNYFSSHSRR